MLIAFLLVVLILSYIFYGRQIAEVYLIDLGQSEQNLVTRFIQRDQPGVRVLAARIKPLFAQMVERLKIFLRWFTGQRGAGASYTTAISAQNLSLKAIVADGIELSQRLRQEFGRDKIYLEGHSWGTLVGIHMVSQRPDLFHAYFGVGQVANSKRAELLSYNYALEKATKAGDTKTVRGLNKIGSPPYTTDQKWIDTVMTQRGLMQPYEIPNQAPFLSMVDIYKNFVFYPEYSINDKLNSLIGSKLSLKVLWMEAINANLFESHPELEVPVYIFQRKYDMHTVTEVAKDYFDMLNAPKKEYYSFDNSAHWPHLKEHKKYRDILQRIVKKSANTLES